MIGGYRSELGPGSSSQAMISANTAYDPVDTVFWRAHGVVPNCTMIELALPPQDRRRVLEPTKQKEASSLDWNAVLGRDQGARTSAVTLAPTLATHLLMLDSPTQALELSPLMIALVI